MIITLKLIFTIFYFILAILPIESYFLEDLNIAFETPLTISIIMLLFANWTIWSKGILKKIIMVFVMILYLGVGTYLFSELADIQSDYCIEDGDCEEGYLYKNQAINEKYCKELGGTWYINPKHKNYCKLKYYGQ